MKRFLSILLFCPNLLLGQLYENFENGDLLQWDQFPQERWSCSDLDPIEGFFSLRHSFDNYESGVDRISFSLDDLDLKKPVRWDFLIKYEYNPSSTNNWNVFLIADQPAEFMEKESGIKGVILGVNYVGSDDFVSLYNQDENGVQTLLTTSLNWQDLNDQDIYRFIVNFYDDQHFSIEGGINDTTLLGVTGSVDTGLDYANFFGLRYSYTSSKDMLLSMDDVSIKGSYLIDTLPPVLESLKYLNRNSLMLKFDENVYISEDFNLLLNDEIQPDSFEIKGQSIFLFFEENFVNHFEYKLFVTGLIDRKNNEVNTSRNFVFFLPGRGDIRISELMADPSPEVYLPSYEYIELYNTSSEDINLENWELSVGSKQIVLPEIKLKREEYCLLSHPDANFDVIFYPVLSSIYSIPNEGCEIILKNAEKEVIDAIDFSLLWHDEEYKNEGGWSLERIDLSVECGGKENWSSSISSLGGTPMKENSVSLLSHDLNPLYISSINYTGETDFKINFNRQSADLRLLDMTTYRIISGLSQLISVDIVEPFRKSVFLHFDQIAPTQITKLLLDGRLEDCFSSEFLISDTLKFGIPQKASPLDILITEVLFDNHPGSAEYIEIYNRSDKTINLYDLILESGISNEESNEGQFICSDSTLFFPNDYLVLSKSPDDLISYFNSSIYSRFYFFPEMPVLNNSEGRITLSDRSGQVIDEMYYNSKDHFPLLTTEKGASLERLDLSGEFGLNAQWHTASSLVNFGTPGYKNSQFTGTKESSSKIECENEFFTPDNDGNDDLAIINYNFRKEGVLGNVIVFNASGRLVNNLYQHELLGTKGRFYWDGRDGEGRICSTGIYLFFIELIYLEGYKEVFKKTISLVHPIP
jgi:Lamin Tail Domain